MSIVSSWVSPLAPLYKGLHSKRALVVLCGLLCFAYLFSQPSAFSPSHFGFSILDFGTTTHSKIHNPQSTIGVLPPSKIQNLRSTISETPVPMLFGSAPDAPDSQLQAIVDDTVGSLNGTWGVAIKKLDTGQYAVLNGDKQQVSASLYKMWALEELYDQAQQGILSLDDSATVTSDDAYEDLTYGSLSLDVGTTMTLREFARQMITISDNTAAHVLVRTLGLGQVNAFMQQNGLANSYLSWDSGGDNLTTPVDVLHELELLATSRMVDAASSKAMVDTMLDQQINDLIPVGLPDGVPFAHKTGSLDSLMHDAGIVYGPSGPFVIVVMASNLDTLDDAYTFVPKLAAAVYDYFNSRSYSPAMYFPQTRQTVGHDFLKFWQVYGGANTFGFPIGPEQIRNGTLTQDFQRARFEWHPGQASEVQSEKSKVESVGSKVEGTTPGFQLSTFNFQLSTPTSAVPGVVLSPLGQLRARQLGLQWPPGTDPGAGGGQFFADTRQMVQGGFLQFWNNNGGLLVFGEPISPEFSLVNSDGAAYTVQYFLNVRMEYHPELPAGQRVTLGNLGSELAGAH